VTPRRRLIASTVCSLGMLTVAPAWATGTAAPQTVTAALVDKQALASTRLRVWGFEVYDARLWARPGFEMNRFEAQPFALELNYLRNFQGADIARRSVEEMRQTGALDESDAARWLAAMGALFPDVQKGDRITGVHLPGAGARFYLNERLLGEVAEARFSRRFFGIWLSEQTTQPRMRDELLAQLQRQRNTPRPGSSARAPGVTGWATGCWACRWRLWHCRCM